MYISIFIIMFQIRQFRYIGCLRGAGDTLYTAVASTASVTVIRTSFSYLCCYIIGLGTIGIWLGVFVDQFSRYLFATLRFRSGCWLKIKI